MKKKKTNNQAPQFLELLFSIFGKIHQAYLFAFFLDFLSTLYFFGLCRRMGSSPSESLNAILTQPPSHELALQFSIV